MRGLARPENLRPDHDGAGAALGGSEEGRGGGPRAGVALLAASMLVPRGWPVW